MGRGVSAGGGQSSLGYLFGSGESSNKAQAKPQAAQNPVSVEANSKNDPNHKPAVASKPSIIDKNIPAGIHGSPTNNYFRADGQNCGNFITVFPSPFLQL